MWFISVEVEQETSAPPPKKNPGSAPEPKTRYNSYNKNSLLILSILYTHPILLDINFHYDKC